jgi:hypothetical protein
MNVLKRLRTGTWFRAFAVAAVLVLSQLAVACHQTAHFAPDLTECELCVCQAQPLCAPLPTTAAVPLVAQQHLAPMAAIPALVSSAPWSSYHSRAPPLHA